MDAAWPGMAVEESNLSVQIASLRKLLGPSPDGGEWIATIPRVGYRFVGEPEATTPGEPRTASSEPVIPSLAVLPFQNLSGDPEQDYFADGVVEDIITALSRFKSFAVIARNSSFVYKGRAVDVRQVARELGVRYVLEGSVRRAGERLRITAQLVDGDVGRAPLGRQVRRRRRGRIRRAGPDHRERRRRSSSRISDGRDRAIAAQAPGRHRCVRSLSAGTVPDLQNTIDGECGRICPAQRAVALEPDNGLILSQAAFALGHRSAMGWQSIGPDDREKCVQLARRALEHAAGDATVVAQCGMSLLHTGREYDWGMAVVQSAAEANPNNLMIVTAAGIANLHCGNIEDALAYFHRALRLNPRDPGAQKWLTGIAHAHMILGNYPEALVWATRSLALNAHFNATYWMLIAAHVQLGQMEEARHWLARLLTSYRTSPSPASAMGNRQKTHRAWRRFGWIAPRRSWRGWAERGDHVFGSIGLIRSSTIGGSVSHQRSPKRGHSRPFFAMSATCPLLAPSLLVCCTAAH